MKTKDGWVTGTVAWHVPESKFDHYPKDKSTFCDPNTTITCMVKGCEATRDLWTEPEFVPGLDYQVRCQRGASHPDLRYYTCDERGEFRKFAFNLPSRGNLPSRAPVLQHGRERVLPARVRSPALRLGV